MGNIDLRGKLKQDRLLKDQLNQESRNYVLFDGVIPSGMRRGDTTDRISADGSTVYRGIFDGKKLIEFTGGTATSASSGVRYGLIEFVSTTYGASEDDDTCTVAVRRRNGSTGAVTVDVVTTGGTADEGTDYTMPPTPITLSWASGETGNKTFDITILGDLLADADETILLKLENATGGATIGSRLNCTVTIADANPGPAPYYDFDPASFDALADNAVAGNWDTSSASTGTAFAALMTGSPIIKKSILNGCSVVQFPVGGRARFARRPFPSNADWGICLVYKAVTPAASKTLINLGNSDTTEFGGFFLHQTTGEMHIVISSVNNYNSAETYSTGGAWHVLIMTRSTAGGFKAKLDTHTLTYSPDVPAINAFDCSFPYPFHDPYPYLDSTALQVAQMSTYDVGLSDDDIADIFAGMAGKFGLTY